MEVFIFIAGIIIGVLIKTLVNRSKFIDTLIIDTSDPDGPYMFLELKTPIDKLYKAKVLNVKISRR